HQATRKFPNVDHLTSWPGRNLRFGKLSHFSSQRIDADSAEWRSDELAVMRMLMAGGTREAHAQPSRGRIFGATRQQAHPPPCCGIGQQLAIERRAGGQHQWNIQQRRARPPNERQRFGKYHKWSETRENAACRLQRIKPEPQSPAPGSGASHADRL